MNDFIPSDAFVEKTMDKITAYETEKALTEKRHAWMFSPLLLRTGAFSISFVVAVVNILRLYFALFAPVVSH
jgi:hypothetical protein